MRRDKTTLVECQRYLAPIKPSWNDSVAVAMLARSCPRRRSQSSNIKRFKTSTSPSSTQVPSAAPPLFSAQRYLQMTAPAHTSTLPRHPFEIPPWRLAQFTISKSPTGGTLSSMQVSRPMVFGHIDRLWIFHLYLFFQPCIVL